MRYGAKFLVLGAAAAAVAYIPATRAQDLLTMGVGTTVEGAARFGNKLVPLPAGKWELVLSDTDHRGSQKAGNAFLIQKANGGLSAFLYVRTNLEPESGYGWKRPAWCQRNNVHHNGSDSNYNKADASYWIVNHRVHTNKISRFDFLNRMKAYARENGFTASVVGNRYWLNDATDYIAVYHFMNPAGYGFPAEHRRAWVRSAWHPNAVREGTPRHGFVAAVQAFGEKYRAVLRDGLRNRMQAPVPKFAFDPG